jgi:Thioesterase superfamily
MAETNQAITPELSTQLLPGTFPGNLDIELTEITDEHVRGRMRADTVAAWGTMRHLPEGKGFTTVELKVNVLASARDGDELTALGKPLHIGSRTHVWEVQVFRGERLAANFICTQIVL